MGRDGAGWDGMVSASGLDGMGWDGMVRDSSRAEGVGDGMGWDWDEM